ncbi:MAG TPA: hypothetical protein VL326_18915 [Kofleriaceae bacterium]|nr:hypothetical protein [Kofleriaceae bacterium]
MRSSGGRVRASGGRRGSFAASLIVAAFGLAACGDNVEPRLVPARFVYDDGTEQIDRHQLFDRTLGLACTPTQFSDGKKYCAPPMDQALFTNAACTRVVGLAPADRPPREFFATSFSLDDEASPSRVFRGGGPPMGRPAELYFRNAFGCWAASPPYGYVYYELAEELELAPPVRLEPWVRSGTYVVDAWRSVGLLVPNAVEDCEIEDRPNDTSTFCRSSFPQADFYADSACTELIGYGVPSDPNWTTSTHDDVTTCTMYWRVGTTRHVTSVFRRSAGLCVEEPFPSDVPVGILTPTDGPRLPRKIMGNGRIRPILLEGLPLFDDLLHDDLLDTDCRRLEDGRCVPGTTAVVESWFADPACGQPIDVAMVPTGGCRAPMPYAERAGMFYPVRAPYAAQLYQLSTGDTCQIYNPPAPFVAHSIGPALGADAFARATLTIE